MKDHKCFSFWVPEKKAAALEKAQESAKKKLNRKVGIAEIVMPAVEKFVKAHK